MDRHLNRIITSLLVVLVLLNVWLGYYFVTKMSTTPEMVLTRLKHVEEHQEANSQRLMRLIKGQHELLLEVKGK